MVANGSGCLVLFNGCKGEGRIAWQARHRGGRKRGCESGFHAGKARGVSREGTEVSVGVGKDDEVIMTGGQRRR